MAAWADGINLTNQFGTVIITNGGISLSNSELKSFDGKSAPSGHALGSVYFSTGALTSGTIWTGGTFSSVGSQFVIASIGTYGLPKGIIFSGTFVGPISWTLVSHSHYTYVFTLSGEIKGKLNGRTVTGTTTQTIVSYQNQWFQDHQGSIRLGGTHLNTPEPGTLGLFGTGLIALAGIMRRKLARS